MSMQPGNPIVGSTVLRRPAIQSPNYVQGVSGWIINQDGTAEFNGLTVTGGQIFLVDNIGLLIAALSSTAGTHGADQYDVGLTIANNARITLNNTIPGVSIVIDPNNSSFNLPTILFNRNSTSPYINAPLAGTLQVSADGSGSSRAIMQCEPADGYLSILRTSDSARHGGRLHVSLTGVTIGWYQAGVDQGEFGTDSAGPHAWPSLVVQGANGSGNGPITAGDITQRGAPVISRVGSSSGTSSSSGFTTETVVDTVSANLVSGKLYEIQWNGLYQSTVAGDVVNSNLKEDSATGTRICDGRTTCTVANTTFLASLRGEYTAVATGSKTFVLTGTRTSGTGTITRIAAATDASLFTINQVG